MNQNIKNETYTTNSNSQPKNSKRNFPREKVYIINESYADIKNLSDIYADLLYSAYKKQNKQTHIN